MSFSKIGRVMGRRMVLVIGSATVLAGRASLRSLQRRNVSTARPRPVQLHGYAAQHRPTPRSALLVCLDVAAQKYDFLPSIPTHVRRRPGGSSLVSHNPFPAMCTASSFYNVSGSTIAPGRSAVFPLSPRLIRPRRCRGGHGSGIQCDYTRWFFFFLKTPSPKLLLARARGLALPW